MILLIAALAFLGLAECQDFIRPDQDATTKLVCQRETMSIDCLPGQRIEISYAYFGRQNGVICNVNEYKSQEELKCPSQYSSLSFIRKRCQDRRSCTIPADPSVLGDPCYNVNKYLEVSYRCVYGNLLSRFVCETQNLDITCPGGKHIVVNDASFGRFDPVACILPGMIISTNTCRAPGSLKTAVKMCDGKTTCSLPATVSLFGDPCPKEIKMLEVKYTCQ